MKADEEENGERESIRTNIKTEGGYKRGSVENVSQTYGTSVAYVASAKNLPRGKMGRSRTRRKRIKRVGSGRLKESTHITGSVLIGYRS